MPEIYDPIHAFVRYDDVERKVIDSRAVQRLRHIHQLGLTCLVYPGASHKRFEHSLGVMELAGRVYDVLTDPDNVHDSVRAIVPGGENVEYWRRVLRMAALVHDVGHLPFSHSAEDLLPDGWDHERLTLETVRSAELQEIWEESGITPGDVALLAVGPEKWDGIVSDWQAILSEIITGDAFGVDRMDYLLRDAHHTGVPHGKFDYLRLINTMRILPKGEEESSEPALGVEAGGLHAAEALLLARYFMYTTLYCHPVRRVYDLHLKDFLGAWLPGGKFATSVHEHMMTTDNEVSAALLAAAHEPAGPTGVLAKRIVDRQHFRRCYERNPQDLLVNPEAARTIHKALAARFGESEVRHDSYRQKGNGPSFPVLTADGRVESSLRMSTVLQQIPVLAVDYVFISPTHREESASWLSDKRDTILSERGAGDDEEA